MGILHQITNGDPVQEPANPFHEMVRCFLLTLSVRSKPHWFGRSRIKVTNVSPEIPEDVLDLVLEAVALNHGTHAVLDGGKCQSQFQLLEVIEE